MEVLAIIPARGGSKGILRKNLRLLAGKPLLAHTILQAKSAQSVSRVVVSTDDDEIRQVALAYGAEVITRPAAISGDEASSESALLHSLEHLKQSENYVPDIVLFLQCTSPLRRQYDLDRAVAKMQSEQADSLLSVVPTVTWLWRVVDDVPQSVNYDYRKRLRRQERPAEFNENGSIYAFKPWVLLQNNNRLGGKTSLYEMDEWSNIDIETTTDIELAELILQNIYHQSSTP